MGLDNDTLVAATEELSDGLCEAALGGGIYKKRIGLPGKGKSGGVRTIIAYKSEKIAVFMYGFAKSKKDNITDKELTALKHLAKLYFSYDDKQLKQAVHHHELLEVIKK